MPVFLPDQTVNDSIIAYACRLAKVSLPWNSNSAHILELILREEGKIGPVDYYRHYNHFKNALEFDR
jgi:hypothetical protein